MELNAIGLIIDRKDEMYASDNCQEVLAAYVDYYQIIGYHFPWVGYFVVRDDLIVGSCGFKGQPKNGKVEIAYWTFKEFEQQGIATFSCIELVRISQQFDPTIVITATTAPEHNASTKILVNSGFIFAGMVHDHEIGSAWLWTHKK